MKRQVREALLDTLPVMTGYLVLGFGFGIITKVNGYTFLHGLVMSVFIYAGSMQYAAIGLMTGGASLVTAAVTTLMVNARHLFYGISMIEKYKNTGIKKPYLIFALTDETYSLVCSDKDRDATKNDIERKRYYFLVSFMNHFYWILGTILGLAAGMVFQFNSEGIDFALTALFVTVFLEQWMTARNHFPAMAGVGISLLCLLLFGSENFLIPSMIFLTILLSFYKGEEDNE